MYSLTCDSAIIMTQITKDTQDYTNCKSGYGRHLPPIPTSAPTSWAARTTLLCSQRLHLPSICANAGRL